MKYGLLGNFEVWSGSRRLAIAGRAQPRILAGLLLNVGRTVTVDWLIDLLWPDDPPASARRQVQNAIAALRRRFRAEGIDPIERGFNGYRLIANDVDLDIRQFSVKTRQARQFFSAGDTVAALKTFAAALSLWRGPAFSGLSGRVFEAAALRLNDSRLSAYEDYAVVALSRGEPDLVADELNALIVAHPLRQRLTARLMHARYQQHRGPEAARLYETLRHRLSGELGLEPSPEIAELHARIMQSDPLLLPLSADRVVTVTRPAAVVPAELPADVATFTGRSEQLAVLDRLHESGSKAAVVSTVAGIGGVGKTALIVHWGHTVREDFPDGQVYLNLRGFDEREPLQPYEALCRLLRSLGVAAIDVPADTGEAGALYRSLLSDKRVLLVLDNARDSDQVRPLLPSSPGCLALVASRARLSGVISGNGAEHVEVDCLSAADSLGLLVKLLGSRAAEDTVIARRLCDLCGRLPLALRIAAANLTQSPQLSLREFVDDLDDESRLAKLNLGLDGGTNLEVVFSLSRRALTDAARRGFGYLGLIPGNDFTVSLAAAVCDESATAVGTTLTCLIAAHLLEEHEPGRYRFHDLIRLYARKTADQDLSGPDRAAAVDRLIDWHGDKQNRQPIEFDNYVATCEALQAHPRLWEIAEAFGFFTSLGHGLLTSLRFTGIALEAALESGELRARIRSLSAHGTILLAMTDSAGAIDHFERAARLLPEAESRELEGLVLGDLGIACYVEGRLSEAERHLAIAMRIADITGDRHYRMTCQANLGRVFRAMGRYRTALLHLNEARAIASDLGAEHHEASVLTSLAILQTDMGQFEQARATAERTLELTKSKGTTKFTAFACHIIAKTLACQGHVTEAFEAFATAELHARRVQRLGIQTEILHDKAELYIKVGDIEAGFACLSVTRNLIDARPRDNATIAQQHRITCLAHTASGACAEAVPHGQRAVGVYRTERQDPLRLAGCLLALGEAHHGLGDTEAATVNWNEALEIFSRLDVPEATTVRAKLAS